VDIVCFSEIKFCSKKIRGISEKEMADATSKIILSVTAGEMRS
jgi:hypothetical protein